MNICLAFAFQDSAHWLRIHFDSWMKSYPFAGVVALDGGSRDNAAHWLRERGVTVCERAFDWDFGAHMNALITACADAGYDAVFRLDPDELVENAQNAVAALEYADAVYCPRVNFVRDRLTWLPHLSPDYQTRVFRLRDGVGYSGRVHETLTGYDRDVCADETRIFHYGWIERSVRRQAQFMNYDRIAHGLAPIAVSDVSACPTYPVGVAFADAQPVSPYAVGVYAPFGENE